MTFAVFAAEDVLRKAAQGIQVNPLDLWIAENKVAAARRLEREQEIAEREEALRSPALITYGGFQASLWWRRSDGFHTSHLFPMARMACVRSFRRTTAFRIAPASPIT